MASVQISLPRGLGITSHFRPHDSSTQTVLGALLDVEINGRAALIAQFPRAGGRMAGSRRGVSDAGRQQESRV